MERHDDQIAATHQVVDYTTNSGKVEVLDGVAVMAECAETNGESVAFDDSALYAPIDAGKQYDAAGYRGERHITDDLLFKYLFRIRQEIGPKGTLFTIVDACHAGDVERDDDFQTIRGTNEGLTPNSKNKYNPPKQAARKRIMSSPELAPVLYVEACESYQRNQEVTYQRQEYGALSFNVWQTLKQQRLFPANIHAFEDALSKNIQRNKDEHNYLWPGTQDVVFSKSE